jgi:hypothetical protein
MERVKMLMQLQSQREAAGGKAFSGSAISLAKRILANEGYRVNLKHHSRVVTIDSSLTACVVLLSLSRQALYRGNGANVVRIIPNYGLKFMFNDTFKNIVKRPGSKLKTSASFSSSPAGTNLPPLFDPIPPPIRLYCIPM